MKILVFQPWPIDEDQMRYMRQFVPPEVDIAGLKKGHGPTERLAELKEYVALTLTEELDAIVKAERDGYDAVVVGCLIDPGVEVAREIVKIPVLASFQAVLHLAGILGNHICVITPSRYESRWGKQHAKSYGFESNISFRAIGSNTQELLEQSRQYKETGKVPETLKAVINQCIHAIEDDDAEVLTLACGALMWTVAPAKAELSKRGYDIPFIIPLQASIEIAKVLVNLKLTHSNLFYPKVE